MSHLRAGFIITVTLAALAGSAQATTYNAVTDFAGVSNPYGQWSYGYGVTGSSFTALNTFTNDVYGPNTLDAWSSNGATDTFAQVGMCPTGCNLFGQILISNTELWMHPGAGYDPISNQDAIVRWTAPNSGQYTVSGFFERLQIPHGNGVDVSVLANQVQQYSSYIGIPPADHTHFPFSFVVQLLAGQTIDFGVDNHLGDYSADSTGFDVTISETPLPATWTMMLLGLSGLSLLMVGRKKKATLAI